MRPCFGERRHSIHAEPPTQRGATCDARDARTALGRHAISQISKETPMKRLLVLSIGGGLAVGAVGLIAVNAQQARGAVFIAGDRPVTEDQVRAKLQIDGWSDVRIVREGRYFQVSAAKGGQAEKFAVDQLTGRLR